MNEPVRPEPQWPFTADDEREMRDTLNDLRASSVHQPGRWMTSGINRIAVERAPRSTPVRLRDITLRTIEQMGLVRPAEQRRELLVALAAAGVDEVIVTALRRDHQLADLRADVQAAKRANPDCRLIIAGANTEDDLQLAADAGFDAVQVWMGPYLGAALPAVSGAVYHRAWQGRDWRGLRFPREPAEQTARVARLIKAGERVGVEVGCSIALLSWADLDYIETFCREVSELGCFDVMLGDHSSSLAPDGWTLVCRTASAAMITGGVSVHSHDMFGLASANAVAGLLGGAHVAEVSVNGYTDGPAQGDLAHVVGALEMIHELPTNVDLAALTGLSRLAEKLTGVPVASNRGLTGTEVFDLIGPGDEYVQEYAIDPLIHTAVAPEVVGNSRRLQVNITTGPWSLRDKLRELGFAPTADEVDAALDAARRGMRSSGRGMSDDEVGELARDLAIQVSAAQSEGDSDE